MRLWDEVETVCHEMDQQGWGTLFSQHDSDPLKTLDLTKTGEALKAELRKELSINRQLPGFEDFHPEGIRAIEPGVPAKSLLYHVLASSEVPLPEKKDYPRLRFWIETIENYVYGVKPPTWEDLRARADGRPMAVVVFAYDYRPAALTPHRRYADMCFSRTGVARVGTLAATYDPQARAFSPFNPEAPNKIPVLPARYGAFIAVREKGNADFLGNDYLVKDEQNDDTQLDFWVPMHKLFPGSDCLSGIEKLTVIFQAHHVNEKLRRFHIALHEEGFQTGWTEPFLSQPPFIFRAGIAKLQGFSVERASHSSSAPLDRGIVAGSVVVFPEAKEHLVEPAIFSNQLPMTPLSEHKSSFQYRFDLRIGRFKIASLRFSRKLPKSLQVTPEQKNTPITYQVPINYVKTKYRGDVPMMSNILFSSLCVPARPSTGIEGENRSAPKVIYARHQIRPDEQDLNRHANVRGLVATGGYAAQHYLDFTGDGWLEVSCLELKSQTGHPLSAYSIIAPPDFLPYVSQRQVYNWWKFRLPFPLQGKMSVWQEPPFSLADHRFAPNLNLKEAQFSALDTTMTAVITCRADTVSKLQDTGQAGTLRVSSLPDGAAGIFAPGWDISLDITSDQKRFLTGYGGGSPFIEDTISCAALSSFWPAAAPDTARVFRSQQSDARSTVVPLTDQEIGCGGVAWDGLTAPERYPHELENRRWARYHSLENVDYVRSALADRFTLQNLVKVSPEQYTRRAFAMQQVYVALGIDILSEDTQDKGKWTVFSFRPITDKKTRQEEEELKELAEQYPIEHSKLLYRWELFRPAKMIPDPDDLRFRLVEITQMTIMYTVDMHTFWKREKETKWYEKVGLF